MRRLIPALLVCLFASTAHALVITPGSNDAALIAALANPAAGLTINSLTISGNGAGGTASWGTYTNASGTYGIGPGIVISSGAVAGYGDGANTNEATSTAYNAAATAQQSAILAGISGAADYFDVTQIDISYTLDAAHDTVFFTVVFGSEEFAEFVGTTFIDGFGLLVDGANVAFVNGQPINVNHPAMAPVAGTELDGILSPNGHRALTFSRQVGFGHSETLTFIIADRGDDTYDSTAYIASLGGVTTLSFEDVLPGYFAEPSIASLVNAGVTAGCVVSPSLYCPESPVTREQMAVFILKALGETNPPVPATQRFTDVPPSSPFFRFIDRLAALGITGGCSSPTEFCPTQFVTREQMAAFIIKALGETHPPVPATQHFPDVPPSNPFYAFIDRLTVLGITGGCTSTDYCPAAAVTRAEMAVFLVKAFSLGGP
jgi:hypothetical protein